MRAPAVMAVPAFRTYFTAQAVSAFGSAMSALAVTFAIIGLCASAGQLGLVLASGTVPSLVFPELVEGTYELYRRPAGPVELIVTIRGGAVTEAAWPA